MDDDLKTQDVLDAVDAKLEKVFVKEWAGSVYLRVMSVGERDAHELDWLEHKEKGVANFRTKFLLKVLCDKNGKLLFTETHMPLLVLKSASVMNRLWEKAMKLNALSAEDVEELAGELMPVRH